jgi:hypothetical protein
MIQEIIDRAVKIATKSAMEGNPVRRIVWIAPTSASQDCRGTFAIDYVCYKYEGHKTCFDYDPM